MRTVHPQRPAHKRQQRFGTVVQHEVAQQRALGTIHAQRLALKRQQARGGHLALLDKSQLTLHGMCEFTQWDAYPKPRIKPADIVGGGAGRRGAPPSPVSAALGGGGHPRAGAGSAGPAVLLGAGSHHPLFPGGYAGDAVG